MAAKEDDITRILKIVQKLPEYIDATKGRIEELPANWDHVKAEFLKLGDVPARVGRMLQDVETIGKLVDKIPDIATNVTDLPQSIKRLVKDIDDLGRFFGAFGGTQGELFKSILSDFFANSGDIFTNPFNKLILDNPDVVKRLLAKLGQYLSEASSELLKAFVLAFDPTSLDQLGEKLIELREFIFKILSTVLGSIVEAIASLVSSSGVIPASLWEGPLQGLRLALTLNSWVSNVRGEQFLSVRRRVVVNSVARLFGTSGASARMPVIGALVEQAAKKIEAVFSKSKSPEDAVFEIIKDVVFPSSAFTEVIESAVAGKVWAWASLPSGMTPGMIEQWMNSGYIGDAIDDPDLYELEREFRTRLVNAANTYFRERLGQDRNAPRLIPRATNQISPSVASDVVALFVDTVVQFMFEAPLSAALHSDLEDFEAVERQFANLYAGQIDSIVRTTVGTLLRGIWVFSVQNEALIEIIASAVGTFFSSTYAAVSRHLLTSLRVLSKYEHDQGSLKGSLATWASGELVRSGDTNQTLEYVAMARGPEIVTEPLPSVLVNVLKDYTVFVEASYRQFRDLSIFSDYTAGSIDGDVIKCDISQATNEITILVRAKAVTPPETVPVLRALFLGRTYVMQYNKANLLYELRRKVDRVPHHHFFVRIVSSRGAWVDTKVKATPYKPSEQKVAKRK